MLLHVVGVLEAGDRFNDHAQQVVGRVVVDGGLAGLEIEGPGGEGGHQGVPGNIPNGEKAEFGKLGVSADARGVVQQSSERKEPASGGVVGKVVGQVGVQVQGAIFGES